MVAPAATAGSGDQVIHTLLVPNLVGHIVEAVIVQSLQLLFLFRLLNGHLVLVLEHLQTQAETCLQGLVGNLRQGGAVPQSRFLHGVVVGENRILIGLPGGGHPVLIGVIVACQSGFGKAGVLHAPRRRLFRLHTMAVALLLPVDVGPLLLLLVALLGLVLLLLELLLGQGVLLVLNFRLLVRPLLGRIHLGGVVLVRVLPDLPIELFIFLESCVFVLFNLLIPLLGQLFYVHTITS